METRRGWFQAVVAGATLLLLLLPPLPRSAQAAAYSAQWIWQNGYPTLRHNQCYRFVVQFRNSGTSTWYRGIVNLGTDRPQDRIPSFIREDRCTFQPSGWISGNRVELQESSVPPGGTGTFVFWYTVPSTHSTGVFREYFRPVADGITWMEDWGVYWDVSVVSDVSAQRAAVIREAFYALNPGATGSSTRSISTGQGLMAAGDWNYLASDQTAYSYMRSKYGTTYSSAWRNFPYPYQYRYSNSAVPNIGPNPFMNRVADYGLYAGYGRGGQCKIFADTILYRSSGRTLQLPTYNTMQYYTRESRFARPGDVIFRYPYAVNHVAIVVRVLAGDPNTGTVTSVDVIDANWCSNCEIIQRHPISGTTLAQFRVYTGQDQGWNW